MQIKLNNQVEEVAGKWGMFSVFGLNFFPVVGSTNQLRAMVKAGEFVFATALVVSDEEAELFVDKFAHLTPADHKFIASQEAYKS